MKSNETYRDTRKDLPSQMDFGSEPQGSCRNPAQESLHSSPLSLSPRRARAALAVLGVRKFKFIKHDRIFVILVLDKRNETM